MDKPFSPADTDALLKEALDRHISTPPCAMLASFSRQPPFGEDVWKQTRPFSP